MTRSLLSAATTARLVPSAALTAAFALVPSPALAASGSGGVSDLFWPALNLGLLLGLLFWLGRKPIQAWFRARRDHIHGELQSAAEMRREAEERHASWQRRLAELDDEVGGIRDAARQRAEAERERILADARAAADRIRNDARLAVDQELRRAREELREEASDLSLQLAGEMLEQQVTAVDRDRLIDEFIEKIAQPSTGKES